MSLYKDRFGLTSKPFQLSPDPRMLFLGQHQKQALSYIEYGLHQGEGFIVITGEPGVGKSILLRSIRARMNPNKAAVATLFTPQLSEDDMLRMLSYQFHSSLDGMTKADLLTKLVSLFSENTQQSKRNLLLIDEAHKLTEVALEELRLLTELQVNYTPLLQIVLFAQPQFRTTLKKEALQSLRQRIISSFHLQALEPNEVPIYIQHRLKRAQWNSNPSFEKDALIDIYELTEGIPRRINIVMDRAFLWAYAHQENSITKETILNASIEIEKELSSGESAQI